MQRADELAHIGGGTSKWELEKYLREQGLPTTVLRPAYIMETLPVGPLYGISRDSFPTAVEGEVKMGLIATEDIGSIAALAFAHPTDYIGRTLELAGDSLTPPQIAEAIGRATGRNIRYVPVPIATIEQQNAEIARAVTYLNGVGYSSDIAALRERYPDLMAFDAWLKRYGTTIFA